MSVAVEVRPATTDDRDAIVAVFLACWKESYAGVLPQAVIDAMTDDRARTLWTHLLSEDAGTVVVAEVGQAVVGVTRYATEDRIGVVHSLYVSPRTQGMGVGTRLLHQAADAMTAGGRRSLRLWVFAANTPSIAFYRSRGWLPDGGTRTQEEFGEPELSLRHEGVAP